MSTQDFGTMDPNASLKQVINSLAELMDTLNFLLNGNLDVKNIRAKSITADRMNVKELSAIAANLGHITAGLIEAVTIIASTITGGTIRTAASGNRIEMQANNLTTYNSANRAQGPCWGNTFGSNFGDLSFFDDGFETLLIKSLGSGSGYQISARSGAAMNLGATGTLTYGLGNWDMQGSFKVNGGANFRSVFQSNSAASTVPGIVADFNTLLTNLRSLNILV